MVSHFLEKYKYRSTAAKLTEINKKHVYIKGIHAIYFKIRLGTVLSQTKPHCLNI